MANDDLARAKDLLPLPALLHQLGLGEHAKKSTLCPFHDDQRNSFSIWHNNSGRWLWKCHAGCGEGDEITFLQKLKTISNSEAIREFKKMAGVMD
jgi:DNA primase